MAAAEEINPLELSDDEIDAAIMRELSRSTDDTDTAEEEVVEDTTDTTEELEEESEDDLQDQEEGQQETEDEVDDSSELDQEDSEDDTNNSDNTDNSIDNTEDSSNIDYKTEYDELFKPFKANGREMQIESIEEARTLMQMGANYNKKMAALKPNLKLMKLLENNDLLNQDKISFLIDLNKKDPEAIKKLLNESGIDPLDIDVNTKADYQPKAYNVSDAEIELDSVLGEIKDTATFHQTMDIIGNKWDEASQEAVVKEPELIRVINEQVESGLYDRIMSAVERERALGKLRGLSDIQAYYQVGQQITANDAKAQPSQSISKSQPNIVNKATNTVDPKLKSRKKAASSTKSVPRTQKEDFNPLAMSDEEFSKLVAEKFI